MPDSALNRHSEELRRGPPTPALARLLFSDGLAAYCHFLEIIQKNFGLVPTLAFASGGRT